MPETGLNRPPPEESSSLCRNDFSKVIEGVETARYIWWTKPAPCPDIATAALDDATKKFQDLVIIAVDAPRYCAPPRKPPRR
jgi:hypothetical protein